MPLQTFKHLSYYGFHPLRWMSGMNIDYDVFIAGFAIPFSGMRAVAREDEYGCHKLDLLSACMGRLVRFFYFRKRYPDSKDRSQKLTRKEHINFHT